MSFSFISCLKSLGGAGEVSGGEGRGEGVDATDVDAGKGGKNVSDSTGESVG